MEKVESKKYVLNVKRGLFWSERDVVLTENTIRYFIPSILFLKIDSSEMRFGANLSDCLFTETNRNDVKEYTVKIESKSKLEL